MASTEEIARSIGAKLGDAGVIDKLAALPASELTSLLLAVFQARAAGRSFADVRRQFAGSAAGQRSPGQKATAPSSADLRALAFIDRCFFDVAGAFEAVDLAPVAPFGLSTLTGIDQNNVLTALRSLEVLADPTAMLALLVAERRRNDRASSVKLLSSARVLRMQPFPDVPGFSQHFRLLCLVSGGGGGPAFEVAALVEHVGVWLALLARVGFQGSRVRVRVSSSSGTADAEHVSALASAFPGVAVAADDQREQGRGYYAGPMMGIDVLDNSSAWSSLGDGGAVAWTRSLVDDQKERLFTSGFGAELLVKRFGVVDGAIPRAAGPA